MELYNRTPLLTLNVLVIYAWALTCGEMDPRFRGDDAGAVIISGRWYY